MPPPESRTCPACKKSVTNKEHVYTGWCPTCKQYRFEIWDIRTGDSAPPISLDTMIGDIMRESMLRPSPDRQVEIGFETIRDKHDLMAFRAFVKVDGRVREYSRRTQISPQDALRELWNLCRGVRPEDI